MTARRIARGVGVLALAAACGCASPSGANIQLRKQNQDLSSQVEELKRGNAGLSAQVDALQAGRGEPGVSESRLDQLFTVHGISIGRLTGGYGADPNEPDQMLKVYTVPTDDDGEPIKAAGAITVELVDPASNGPALGRWEFSARQARSMWYGHALLYTYILDCPWQKIPAHKNLVVNVTFTDLLTGRQFSAHADATVNPPTTQP